MFYVVKLHPGSLSMDLPQSTKNLHVGLKAEMMSVALELFGHKG